MQPYIFDKLFVLVNLDFNTGASVGEIRYTMQNMQFTEFRLNTDIQNTAADNIYITTSVKGGVNLEFT
jgi:hypothetical protein